MRGNLRMTVAVKNNNKTPLAVPSALRRRAGFKSGEELEIKASAGVITIAPKLPVADGEYTASQRKLIDARLKSALAEVKSGHTAGPFDTAAQMIASIQQQLKRSAPKSSKPKAR